MRNHRCVRTAVLSLLAACAFARLAPAQTYVWTDEHGVVHAAADPAEVPAQYRQKAVENAQVQRPSMTVVPEEPKPPAAASPGLLEAPPLPAHPTRASKAASPDTPPPAPNPDDPDPRTRKLGKPDPGFEWHCLTDPEGGPPKCTQEEKKYDKRQRRAEARDKAEKELGVTPEEEASDPDVAKKVNQRAEEEFKRTTPAPTRGAPPKTPDDVDAEDQD
jgi:hypothetical protein